MSRRSRSSPRAVSGARRRIGGAAAALSMTALLGAGAIVVLASTHTGATSLEMADHARLKVVDQPAPDPPVLSASDPMATLDAEQIAPQKADPLDPALEAMLADERRSDLNAAADQAAFDARVHADPQAGTPPADRQPAQRAGWTSNAEDLPT